MYSTREHFGRMKPMTRAEETGKRIKERRKALGMSQEELALKLDLKSRSAICSVEKGKEDLTIERLRRYAEALMTTAPYLMGLTDIDETTLSEREKDLVRKYRNLLDEDRNVVDQYISFLSQKAKEVKADDENNNNKDGTPGRSCGDLRE